MSPKLPPRVRPGDEITAAWANGIRDALIAGTLHAGQGGGVRLERTAGGTSIAITRTGRYVALVTSTISARSGSTPGSGTVELYTLDPTTPGLVDSGVADTAWNFSSATSIPSGKYCWVEEDTAGNLWVVSAEC